MKELLTEFLSSILTEREARAPGTVWQVSGSKKWSAKRTDGTTETGFESEKTARAWMNRVASKPAAAPAPKKAGKKAPVTPAAKKVKVASPSTQSKAPTKSKPVVTKPSKELAALSRTNNPTGQEFVKVLETGDAKKVAAEIKRMGLYVTSQGKIKARNIAGGRDAQKLFGDSKAVPAKVNKVLSDLGLPILQMDGIKKTAPDPDQPVVDSSVEYLKPSRTYEDRPEIDATADGTGVSIGEAKFHVLPLYEKDSDERAQLVVESQINEIKNRNPSMSDEDAERRADEINGIVQTHNDRVRFLQAAIQKNERFVDLGTGQEAVGLISERLLAAVGKKLPEDKRKEFEAGLNDVASSETVEEFSERWSKFSKTIENIPELSGGSVPLICEHLTGIRNAIQGKHVLIPKSDNFELGDLISYAPEGIETSDVRKMIDSLSLIQVGIDIGSVKREAGGSAAVGSRINATTYTDDRVAADLTIIGRSPVREGKTVRDPGAMGDIYGAKTPEELDDVENRFTTVIKGRMGEIKSYYRIPEGVSDEEIIEGLKNGTPPTYDKKTGEFAGFGQPSPHFEKQCPPGKPISDVNKRQLQLYSLAGYAFEGIYNSTATGQAFSNTTFTSRGVEVSDGIAVMGKARFQFDKKMQCRTSSGTLRDDGIAARIKPSPRTKMRTY